MENALAIRTRLMLTESNLLTV